MSTPGDRPFPSVRIGSFRGIDEVDLDGCSSLNLLVGGNDSGKTTVLEALLLLCGPLDVYQWERAVHLRQSWPFLDARLRGSGSDRLEGLAWLFPHRDGRLEPIDLGGGGAGARLVATAEPLFGEAPEAPIVEPNRIVEGRFRARPKLRAEDGLVLTSEAGLAIDVAFTPRPSASGAPPPAESHFKMVLWQSGYAPRGGLRAGGPRIGAAFVTPILHRSERYLTGGASRSIRSKRTERVVDLLRKLDSRVRGLVIVGSDTAEPDRAAPPLVDRATLHLEIDGAGLVPVHAMGDGIRRALAFAFAIAEADRGSVLLVDEIEVGLHSSALRNVFAWLAAACRDAGVQLFATTHSLEAVDALLGGVPDESLVLYRLDGREARRYDGALLRVARFDLGHEVR